MMLLTGVLSVAWRHPPRQGAGVGPAAGAPGASTPGSATSSRSSPSTIRVATTRRDPSARL